MINNKIIRDLHHEMVFKYKRSLFWYAFLTLLGFALTATLVIFNLYAVRLNPARTGTVPDELRAQQWLFIGIAILSAVQAFLTGILTLFTFRKKSKTLKYKIERIQIQIEKYKKQEGDYESTGRDATLINLVTKIINE